VQFLQQTATVPQNNGCSSNCNGFIAAKTGASAFQKHRFSPFSFLLFFRFLLAGSCWGACAAGTSRSSAAFRAPRSASQVCAPGLTSANSRPSAPPRVYSPLLHPLSPDPQASDCTPPSCTCRRALASNTPRPPLSRRSVARTSIDRFRRASARVLAVMREPRWSVCRAPRTCSDGRSEW